MAGITQRTNNFDINKSIKLPTPSEGFDNFLKSNKKAVEEVNLEEVKRQEIKEVDIKLPEIGDVVNLSDGQIYSASSQGGDYGVIGESVRSQGDYTVDAIAILDNDGNILASYSDNSTNLEEELSKLGFTINDIQDKNIQIKYNVSEGINDDLDRSSAAGWISFDNDNYSSQQNVFEKVPDSILDEEAVSKINELNRNADNVDLGLKPEFEQGLEQNNNEAQISEASGLDSFDLIKEKVNSGQNLTESERNTLFNMDRSDAEVKKVLNKYDYNTNPFRTGFFN